MRIEGEGPVPCSLLLDLHGLDRLIELRKALRSGAGFQLWWMGRRPDNEYGIERKEGLWIAPEFRSYCDSMHPRDWVALVKPFLQLPLARGDIYCFPEDEAVEYRCFSAWLKERIEIDVSRRVRQHMTSKALHA